MDKRLHSFRLGLIVILILANTGCTSLVKEGESQQDKDLDHQPFNVSDQLLFSQEEILPDELQPQDSVMKTPLPSIASPAPTPSASLSKLQYSGKIKGMYVSAWNMKGKGYERISNMLRETDLNAVVVDVKNDFGKVTYPSAVKQVQEIGADSSPIIGQLKEQLAELKTENIYTIARIVVFKDPALAAAIPDYAIHHKNGDVWFDPKGIAWVDPFREEVWDYNIALAKEAVSLGFDEIQFDYVRFPENAAKVDQQVQYHKTGPKYEAIEGFLHKAKGELRNTIVSADVFGLTTSSKDDMGIGQRWEAISQIVDVICPMTYPSHYGKGIYGVANPDLEPYTVVFKALQDAIARNQAADAQDVTTLGQNAPMAQIRPWYQDFTATWVKPHANYTDKEVREQIRAGADNGVEEFLLWNPAGKYTYR